MNKSNAQIWFTFEWQIHLQHWIFNIYHLLIVNDCWHIRIENHHIIIIRQKLILYVYYWLFSFSFTLMDISFLAHRSNFWLSTGSEDPLNVWLFKLKIFYCSIKIFSLFTNITILFVYIKISSTVERFHVTLIQILPMVHKKNS